MTRAERALLELLVAGYDVSVTTQPAWPFALSVAHGGRTAHGFGRTLSAALDDLLESMARVGLASRGAA